MTKEQDIRLRSTNDGIELVDSILWFDSASTGQLSFLSTPLLQKKFRVPQVIATEEAIKILDACQVKVHALKCQYNRPFSIGRLKMELLPSGGTLGGASLHVETTNGKLLYAPYLQTQRVPTVRQMQLKRSNTLILGAHHPSPKKQFPMRKKELERLGQLIQDNHKPGKPVMVLCPQISIAQELTEYLNRHDFSVGVHSKIKKINKIYEGFGSQLGPYANLSSKRKCQVLLYPFPASSLHGIPPMPTGPKIVVNDGNVTFDYEHMEGFVDSISLSLHADGPDLKEVAAAVKPEVLYFFGTYAKSFAEEFANCAPVVKPLFMNDQPTLF